MNGQRRKEKGDTLEHDTVHVITRLRKFERAKHVNAKTIPLTHLSLQNPIFLPYPEL